jgi:hypothetical protein
MSNAPSAATRGNGANSSYSTLPLSLATTFWRLSLSSVTLQAAATPLGYGTVCGPACAWDAAAPLACGSRPPPSGLPAACATTSCGDCGRHANPTRGTIAPLSCGSCEGAGDSLP